MPTGEWKMVMSPQGEQWDGNLIRYLLQLSLSAKEPILVTDSQQDPRLGHVAGLSDQRILSSLRADIGPIGAMFLLSTVPQSLTVQTADFINLFADVVALAIVNCAQLGGGQ
jgi:hypothetical protein